MAPAEALTYAELVRVCERCGEENGPRARFCQGCGSTLVLADEVDEERKIVSVLFIDLVGFTQRADGADPEDVRALLRPYFALLKQEIEGFGGTVEKFIGDAVVGVFGAPVAHEDDPERAVRAALRISEEIAALNVATPGLDLLTRAAVNTGEAVVVHGARSDALGLIAGDVANTAARLQEIGPPAGVLVGEATYLATRNVIDYVTLDPVSLKGKSAPTRAWRAVGPRAKVEVALEEARSLPLVGRDQELTMLKSVYLRALRESCVQLATITGEPGVGKSRLVSELALFVDDQRELVNWRQGRCLPYGKGITFWPLEEIIRGHAGIRESDPSDQIGRKLVDAIAGVAGVDGAERQWLYDALAPLVDAPTHQSRALDRAESFSAWRHFLEAIAASRPLVVVFEDLHWAEAPLLNFVDELTRAASDVPLLVVCTARPELYDMRPDWGGGKRNATSIALSPLSDEETALLLSGLLLSRQLAPATHSALLKRAGGIPLYAEQFIQMLGDRGLLVAGDRMPDLNDEVAVPPSLQALIAARLDTLSPELKSLLHDASVVGETFWSGALATMQALDDQTLVARLQELATKGFVRRAKQSSLEGETEYSFHHVLIRDVAYARIARGARFRKHLAVADWLQSLGAMAPADQLGALADHYTQALELTDAAGTDNDTKGVVEDGARRFLVLAGERAAALDPAAALSYFRRALSLFPQGHPQRPRLLIRAAEANEDAGGPLVESQAYFQQAVDEAERAGNNAALGHAMTGLAHNYDLQGDTAGASTLFDRAIAVLEQEPPGRELASAYVQRAGRSMLAGDPHDTLRWADKALEILQDLDLPEERAIGVHYRGMARCEIGDLDGLEDIRDSVRMSEGLAVRYGPIFSTNLADWLWFIEGPDRALSVLEEVVEISDRFGLGRSSRWAEAEKLWMLFDLGRWDELLTTAQHLLDRTEPHSQLWAIALPYRARVLAARGDIASASALVDEFLVPARKIGDPQIVVPALVVAAVTRQGQGRIDEAADLIHEFAAVTAETPIYRVQELAEAVRLVALADPEGARALTEGVDHPATRARAAITTAEAMIREAEGALDAAAMLYEDAAACWRAHGHVLEEAYALFGWARALTRLDDGDRAGKLRADAQARLTALGATLLIEPDLGVLSTDVVDD